MKTRLIPVLLSSLIAILSASASVRGEEAEKQKIVWLAAEWVPSWIKEGPEKGTGYSDRMEKLLKAALPGFQHQEKFTSVPRVVRELFGEEETCFSAGFYEWIDPETGEPHTDTIWSAPIYLFYWHGLVMLKETRDRLPGGEKIYLSDVIGDGSLRLGLDRGRVYGPALDPILLDYQEADHVLMSGGNKDATANQYRLLSRGRIDYMVDYSFMMEYAARLLKTPDRFVFVPLADHETPHGLGAVACNNSEKGRRVIAAVNKALVDLRSSQEFRDINSEWFMLEGREEEFWRLWEEELLSRSE
ncbi:hypothetical protein [Aestuariispira insulae]|uniref:Uncharacterized protein (TIGR02285 family) n=1 Tax=Aestuariispira insulae TaxID=1461337 RepID=A0A3D9HRD9_9PROT|nr:hypothetical protein [Aestuariispira insulae]RED52019.1 uncharacterized protein (TIGR02285 family) [Aestuariispira insulae]